MKWVPRVKVTGQGVADTVKEGREGWWRKAPFLRDYLGGEPGMEGAASLGFTQSVERWGRDEPARVVNVRGGATWTRGAANFPRSSDIQYSPGAYRTRLRNDSGRISTTWSLGGSRRSNADGGGRGQRIRGSLAAVRT
jgi:hypothetical protein